MPTSSIAAVTSSITSTIQQLEAAYGPAAQAVGHGAEATYFANLGVLKFLSIIISIAFAIGIVIIIRKTGWLRVRLDRIDDVVLKGTPAKKSITRSWGDVERHFFAGSDNDLKTAVIKADTLLDEALREAGIRGKDLGERLHALAPEDLPNIDRLLEAHKIRGRIAHEAGFAVKRDLAEKALTVYEEALVHMGYLPEVPATGQAPSSGSNPDSGSSSRSNLPPGSGPGAAPGNH